MMCNHSSLHLIETIKLFGTSERELQKWNYILIPIISWLGIVVSLVCKLSLMVLMIYQIQIKWEYKFNKINNRMYSWFWTYVVINKFTVC